MVTAFDKLPGMDKPFPSADDIRVALSPLTLKQLEALAETSGVPFATIYKIKRGETKNPGIETLRSFMPHIAAALATPGAPTPAQQEVA